jgi:nonribosomal peptide synthetase MxcG
MSESSERLPLSSAQHGIWLGQQLDPSGALYNAGECLEIQGPVRLDLLASALRATLDEAEALHLRVVQGERGPQQVRDARSDWLLPTLDLSAQTDAWSAARAWMEADLRRPLVPDAPGGLFRAALLSASPARAFVYLAAHHIALDGFGFSLIAQRVAQRYTAAAAQRAPAGPGFGSFAAVIEEDLLYRASADCERDRAFWASRLARVQAPVSPSDRTGFASAAALRHAQSLPLARKAELDALARAEQGSWADALLAAFAGFLHQLTGAPEINLGLPMMGRLGSAALRVPSMVMNIVPLALRVAEAGSLRALTGEVVRELRALRPHARYRYEQLRRDLKLVGGTRRLFGPVVNVMPFDAGLRFAGQPALVHNLAAGPVEDLALNIRARGHGRELALELDANPACYEPHELALLGQQFSEFLVRALEKPERPPQSQAIPASRPASAAVLEGEPLREPARDVVQRFLEHARAQPSEIALESGAERVSYADLALRARRAAALFSAAGARPDSLIAIALPRSVEAIEAILGALLLGAAYVPVDPDGPEARLESILADARPAVIVTSATYRERLAALGGSSVLIDQARTLAPAEAALPGSGAQLAYVMFTSGSTGQPNGVLISRAGLAHFVAAAAQRYDWHARERVLQFAPLQFDASVEEIFVTLCTGGTLILRSDVMLQSIPAFLQACSERGVTLLDLPTAFWHELAYALSAGGVSLPASLRTVIIGGEAARPERVARWRAAAPASVRLFNTYGPTEATVVASSALLSELACGDADEPVPIGTLLPGVRALIADEQGRPVAHGESGELCLAGPALARGYLGRPDLERKRFVTLELGEPARAYRTGDLVRRRADGQLLFLGRVDEELKISGQRVDPSEVEGVLLRHPRVREAAVVAEQRAGAERRLVAHVVAEAPAPSAAELRLHAQRSLLAGAMPAAFVFAAQLPKTSSGKIDRARLRVSGAAPARAAAPPARGLEARILRVWQEVLGAADLARDDDFFERGGQSLQTIQVANRLSLELAREIPVALVFRHPTVAALAAALSAPEQDPRAVSDVEVLEDARLPAELRPEPPARAAAAPERVVLTGSTGFLGAQLLHALLEETHARVVCLVRAPDAGAATTRVRAALQKQGLAHAALAQRVEAIPADLARPRFGLSDAQFLDLARSCDAVYHNGAVVSLVRGYSSMRAVNVLGTQEALRLACSGRAKPLHHVSTLAVAVGAQAGELREAFMRDPPRLRDGYTLSKWAAERLIEQAAERGLPVAIYRLGRVVGAAATGFVNRQDIVFRLLLAGIPAGALPALEIVEPWTPVDFVARAIVGLSLDRPAGPVFHLAPAPQLCLRDVFGWVADYGYPIELCSPDAFRARLRRTQQPDQQATLALLDAQADAAALPTGMGPIRCENVLRALGARGLRCPPIDRRLVHAYLDFCVAQGLLPRPSRARAFGASSVEQQPGRES